MKPIGPSLHRRERTQTFPSLPAGPRSSRIGRPRQGARAALRRARSAREHPALRDVRGGRRGVRWTRCEDQNGRKLGNCIIGENEIGHRRDKRGEGRMSACKKGRSAYGDGPDESLERSILRPSDRTALRRCDPHAARLHRSCADRSRRSAVGTVEGMTPREHCIAVSIDRGSWPRFDGQP